MAAIPEGRRPGTRRHYAQLVSRVLGLAVWPCELIDRNPLPKGFIPRTGKQRASARRFESLRPAEDARLLACTLVPFGARLLYAVPAREGMRLSEALGLRWRHLDLTHGPCGSNARRRVRCGFGPCELTSRGFCQPWAKAAT